MNPKIAVSILILLALSWPSAGTDSLYLGNGTRHQIINLDAGAKMLDQNVQFTRSGFAAPNMPQPMALSSNMMITQARKLMDEAGAARNESVSARDEARATNEEVKALLEKNEENEKKIQSLLMNAEASAAKAAQAEVFFNKTDEAYRKTLVLSAEAKGYADSSAESAVQASESQNRTNLLYNETAVIFSQSMAVYNNMTLLEKEVQTNSDNIRTWMNETMP